MYSWGESESKQDQVCEFYQGEICRPYLMEWKTCILPEEEELAVDITIGEQSILNQELQQLNNLLGQWWF